MIKNDDSSAAEIENFLVVFRLKQAYIFSDAEYVASNHRLVKLRKPEEMPGEKDLQLFREYVGNEMNNLLDPYRMVDSSDFNHIRSLLIARFTLFNARRGGEPSRLLYSSLNGRMPTMVFGLINPSSTLLQIR